MPALRRREFITLVGGAAAAWPLTARAPQPAVPVVGFINSGAANTEAARLTAFRKGLNESGDVFRTFILSREIYAGESGTSRQKPSDRQVLALRALADLTLSRGRDPPSEYQLPPGIKVVAAEAWKEELYRCRSLDRTSANPWARFKELHQGLAARNLIGVRDDFVWLVRWV